MQSNSTATQPLLANEGENEHAEANYSKCYEYSAKTVIGLSVVAVIGITVAVDMLEQVEFGHNALLLGMITIALGCGAAGGVGMCCNRFFFPRNAPAENVPVAENRV